MESPPLSLPAYNLRVHRTGHFQTPHLQFVLLVHDVVQEKEGRVRQAMATMGLRALPFWASWVLFQGMLAAVEACLLVGFGYAFGFRVVR